MRADARSVTRGLSCATALLLALAATACAAPSASGPPEAHRTLRPVAPLFGPGDPLWTPQPRRERPLRVAVNPAGTRAWVTLQGYEDEPGTRVAVVDLERRAVRARVEVGSSPTGVTVHPGGRFVLVTSRYANWASVLDAESDRVVAEVPVDFYATDAVFTPDGTRAYLSNRWKNQVVRWNLRVGLERFEVLDARAAVLAASTHPRDLAVSTDGTRLAVAGLDGLRVGLFSLPDERPVADVDLRAPVNDVLFAGPWLFALTQGPGSGHPPLVGPDTDEDGRPGDSTANSNFQDQQNELAVLSSSDGRVVRRYTSTATCCRDFRDVSPDDVQLGAYLPPRDLWTVAGTVPEAAALCGPADDQRLYVAYLGSQQLQVFRVRPSDGSLTPVALEDTGFGPTSAACAGDGVLVVSSLAERLERRGRDGELLWSLVVGDVSRGEFPSTDAELGELFNVATAPFTVDGSQSCVMCHREFGAPDKAFSMPLLRYPEGTRNTLAHRGLADTRPWFFEAAMDENNFFPVLNEFARVENFCCTDPSLFDARRPPPEDCERNPPPVCATRSWPRSYATRNAFYLAQAQRVLGRAQSFGDAIETPLNFQGITATLGLSLLHRSRLLPSPSDPSAPAARRGRALFEAPSVGCASCHDGPGLAASFGAGRRVRFGPVVTPNRAPDGRNLDLLTEGFLVTFPLASQQSDTLDLGAPSLRGLWAHSQRFLHDGRARSLREVLATPGHPALAPGERGFNEHDGRPDAHGATSHLRPAQLAELEAFLLSQ